MKHSNTNKVGACNAYVVSVLSIKTKTCDSKIDVLKEIMRAWGMNLKGILGKEALSQRHRIYATLTFCKLFR